MSNKKEGYRRLSVIFTWIIGVLGMCWYIGLHIVLLLEGTLDKILESEYAAAWIGVPLIGVFILTMLPKVVYQMWLYAHEGFNKEVSQ